MLGRIFVRQRSDSGWPYEGEGKNPNPYRQLSENNIYCLNKPVGEGALGGEKITVRFLGFNLGGLPVIDGADCKDLGGQRLAKNRRRL